MKKHFTLITFLLFIISVQAQETIDNNEEIITDRPDQTESPSAVGKGRIQIEAGLPS